MVRKRILLTAGLLLSISGGGLHAQERKLIEVTDEMSCGEAPTVFIGNIVRRVTVRTTHENKVRLVTSVAYEGNCRYTNEEWLDKLELKVHGNTGYADVKCGNMERTGSTLLPSPIPFSKARVQPHRAPDLPQRRTLNNLTPNGTVVFDAEGNWLYKKGNIRRDIYVYVPAGAKLEIDSRYAEVIIDSSLSEVKARITNGGLTMKDAQRLVLNSSYGSVYAGNIDDADIALNHGWFHAKDISTLEINSKVSTVELGSVQQIKINSNDDQYDLEEAGAVTGGKNFGSLRLNSLKNSLDLTGVNADIKVHNIERGVTLVKIDDQYADLRLPVDNLKDYSVFFEGTGSNLYTPFQRAHATDSSFNITVGTGRKSAFRLKCSNCTLDMK
ncbi:MAG TPA: hypothetical protein VHE54_12410 [Puia sp.]|nr:hypothetical protein [Puia sp.]